MSFDAKKHLINLKGKEYLETKWRIAWFRDEHPLGKLNTEVVSIDPLLIRASVLTGEGELLATGLGSATAKQGAVWSGREVEKAETAAIGRALGHAGYGTQFTDEDETTYLADSPNARRQPNKVVGKVSQPPRPTPMPSPAPTPPMRDTAGASPEQVVVDGAPQDEIDRVFPKPPNSIVVREVEVKTAKSGKPYLIFREGDIRVTAFTREPLRDVLDESAIVALGAAGKHTLPPMRLYWKEDGDYLSIERAELIAS